MTLKADYSHSANPEIVKLDPALLESSISQALLQVLNSRLHAELFSPRYINSIRERDTQEAHMGARLSEGGETKITRDCSVPFNVVW